MMLNVVLVVCTIAGQNGISSGLTTIHAVVGSQVTLNCNMAIDSTVSDIFWERYKANEKMTFSSNISGISGSTLENPSLIIEVASILDSGLYTCNTKTYNNITHSNATVLLIEGASPDVKLESMSVSSIFGIPHTLQVDIISTPFVKHVYWTKENNFGELVIINARATGFEGGNISVPSLTISSPDFIDGGYYTCYARNDIGLGKSHKISMKVEGAVPLVSLDTLNYEASYGSRVSVKCTVTAFPNHTRIYWQRRKNDIITTITEETIGVTGSTLESPTLTIEFVTISDTGTYTCLAENLVGLGSSRSTLLLVTGGRPVVNIGSALYSTVYGTKVTLYCVVNSDPPCTLVHWKKKSKGGLWSIITSGAVGILGVNVTQPSLTFIFPVDSDAGEYICYATNALGTSSSLSTLLTVIGENPLVSTGSIRNSAKHGAEYTLYCSVDANPVHKEVYWEFRKNDLVRKITSKTPGIRGVNEDNPSLTISFVTISDDGFYTCCAINIVGIGRSKSVRLSVEAAIPFVTAVLQHYSVKEGSGVSMICKVKSEPYQTNVYWQKEKDGQVSKLKHGTTGILGVSLDDPSLTFTAVEKTDSGLYICFATNAIGTGSSRAIILEVEPFTESTATDKTVIIDQQSGDTATWVGSIVGAIAAIATVVATIITYCQCSNRKQPDEDVTPKMTQNDYQNRPNFGPMEETPLNTSDYAFEKPKGIDPYAVEEKKAVPGRDLSIKDPYYNGTDDSEKEWRQHL